MNRPVIVITQAAWRKINSIVASSKTKTMIFSAQSGGCSGFNYNLSVAKPNELKKLQTVKPPATILENKESKVYVDPLTEMYLLHTEIDFVEEDHSKNIFGSNFTFKPDKDKAYTCGCGISFSPKSLD
jgi:iron-sulfur cluster assembly accessory protein